MLLPTVMRFRVVWYQVSNGVQRVAAFKLTSYRVEEVFIQHRER